MGVAPLRPQLTLPVLHPCDTQNTHNPSVPPLPLAPFPSCFTEAFADPNPRDEGVLEVEPPRRAGQSWRWGNTPL